VKLLQFAQDYLATRTRERGKGTVDVTAPRQIEHVTLDTGHARRSPRSAIEDEIIRVLDAAFDRAITTGAREPIPGWAPFSFNVTVEAGAAIVNLWREATPVVTFGIAADPASSPKLWRLLHEGGAGKHATSRDRPPAAPWIGARMEIGAALTAPDDLLWIADFERCLAWAFIDRRGRAQ
jgi:hypothetical protein